MLTKEYFHLDGSPWCVNYDDDIDNVDGDMFVDGDDEADVIGDGHDGGFGNHGVHVNYLFSN